jgi:hypothetical protein
MPVISVNHRNLILLKLKIRYMHSMSQTIGIRAEQKLKWRNKN